MSYLKSFNYFKLGLSDALPTIKGLRRRYHGALLRNIGLLVMRLNIFGSAMVNGDLFCVDLSKQIIHICIVQLTWLACGLYAFNVALMQNVIRSGLCERNIIHSCMCGLSCLFAIFTLKRFLTRWWFRLLLCFFPLVIILILLCVSLLFSEYRVCGSKWNSINCSGDWDEFVARG